MFEISPCFLYFVGQKCNEYLIFVKKKIAQPLTLWVSLVQDMTNYRFLGFFDEWWNKTILSSDFSKHFWLIKFGYSLEQTGLV